MKLKYINIVTIYLTILSIELFLNINVIGSELNKKSNKDIFSASLTDTTNISIEGSFRYVKIQELTGFQPTSLHTKAFIKTDLHKNTQGSVSFWFSPLEELDRFPSAGSHPRNAFTYPFISDVFPPNNKGEMNFGVYLGNGDPQLTGKMFSGGSKNKRGDYRPAYAFIESIKILPGSWYNLVMTWDKKAHKIDIYVNGMLMGYNHLASYFSNNSSDSLFIGCPMMVMRDLTLTNEVVSPEYVKKNYQKNKPPHNSKVDKEIEHLTIPAYHGESILKLDDSWKKAYSCPFSKESDLEGWIVQTDEKYLDTIVTDITNEGLLFKSSHGMLPDARCTLWGPEIFEGDQWLEVEFRVESEEGLALVVLCASGAGREDFITDHELEMTGRMNWILGKTRNYHWEFFRRVHTIRRDMETQVVYKNPWLHHLHYGVIPKLEQNKWYTLRMIKIGNRVQGSIDNKIVFDVEDNPHNHNGPVLNFGRIAIRHMWSTSIRYRNLFVYEKKSNDSNLH